MGPRAPRVVLLPLGDILAEGARRAMPLMVFGIASAWILAAVVVACVLSNEALRLRAELGVRRIFGASRIGSVSMFPVQGGLIGLLGSALGVTLGWLLSVSQGLSAFDRSKVLEGAFDDVGALGVVSVSAIVGLLAGLVPAAGLLRVSESELIGTAPHGSSGRPSVTAHVLIAAQVAVSAALLVGATLAFVSMRNLSQVSPGFPTDRLLTTTVTSSRLRELPASSLAACADYFDTVLQSAGRIPGVESASATTTLPIHGGGFRTTFSATSSRPSCEFAWTRGVSEGYFAALGAPIRAGRTFEINDRHRSPAVAVVNETLARACWPGQVAVGQRGNLVDLPVTVVGVVADVRMFGLRRPSVPELYLPMSELCIPSMSIVLRVRGTAEASTMSSLNRSVRALDSQAQVSSIRSVDDTLAEAEMPLRVRAKLLGVAAVLTVCVSLLGIYASAELRARQQRRERAIRLALGATPAGLLMRASWRALVRAMPGLLTGAVLAASVAGWLAPVLFRVDPYEPSLYAVSLATLALLVWIASWVGGRDVLTETPQENLRRE